LSNVVGCFHIIVLLYYKNFLMCKKKDHAWLEIVKQVYVQGIVLFNIAFKTCIDNNASPFESSCNRILKVQLFKLQIW
jgi:hypothetical protein